MIAGGATTGAACSTTSLFATGSGGSVVRGAGRGRLADIGIALNDNTLTNVTWVGCAATATGRRAKAMDKRTGTARRRVPFILIVRRKRETRTRGETDAIWHR